MILTSSSSSPLPPPPPPPSSSYCQNVTQYVPIKFQRLTEQTKDLPRVSHLYSSVVRLLTRECAPERHGQPGHSAHSTVRDVSHCTCVSVSTTKEGRAGQRFTTAL